MAHLGFVKLKFTGEQASTFQAVFGTRWMQRGEAPWQSDRRWLHPRSCRPQPSPDGRGKCASPIWRSLALIAGSPETEGGRASTTGMQRDAGVSSKPAPRPRRLWRDLILDPALCLLTRYFVPKACA